jgi:hypothetical protein
VAVVLGRGRLENRGGPDEVRPKLCSEQLGIGALLCIHKSSSGLPGSEIPHHLQETCWIAAALFAMSGTPCPASSKTPRSIQPAGSKCCRETEESSSRSCLSRSRIPLAKR